MVISINQQLSLLICSFLSGLIIGIMFDFYRIIRGFENPNKIITCIEDTLFWILAAIIVFVFLLYTDHAFVGIYVYICIGIALIIYLKIISQTFLKVLYAILKRMGKYLRLFKNILLFPVKYIIYKNHTRKYNKIKKIP